MTTHSRFPHPVPGPRSWHPETWAGALSRLVETEVVGGLCMAGAAVVAIVWANLHGIAHLPSYSRTWAHALPLRWLPPAIAGSPKTIVNGALMTIFFLTVGLEIGRERAMGSLKESRNAALPVIAALGGMAGAALAYLVTSIVMGGNASVLRGWGVPMATDVAFTLAALAVFGSRVPQALRVFVLTLAVADDLASVVMLGILTFKAIRIWPLLAASVVIIVMATVVRRRIPNALWASIAGLLVLWYFLALAGIEPPLAGAFAGLLISPIHTGGRLSRVTGPVSLLFVLPLFALANAGLNLGAVTGHTSSSATVFVAILVARVFGKAGGIVASLAVLARLGFSRLPPSIRSGQLLGAALLCGMGFTVPLLFASRVFDRFPELLAAANGGLLIGTLLTYVVGTAILLMATRQQPGRIGTLPLEEGP